MQSTAEAAVDCCGKFDWALSHLEQKTLTVGGVTALV